MKKILISIFILLSIQDCNAVKTRNDIEDKTSNKNGLDNSN